MRAVEVAASLDRQRKCEGQHGKFDPALSKNNPSTQRWVAPTRGIHTKREGLCCPANVQSAGVTKLQYNAVHRICKTYSLSLKITRITNLASNYFLP